MFLTVRNADNGQPIEGAEVILDIFGNEERKEDLKHGSGGISKTDGRFEDEFRISGYTASDTNPWYLKVRKDGFVPQVINIHPTNQPQRPNEKIPLRVEVQLKPVPK